MSMQISSCLHPRLIRNPYTKTFERVPCGKCEACVNTHAKSWSDRIDNELLHCKHAVFVTLTYSDDYLPCVKRTDNINYWNIDKYGNYRVMYDLSAPCQVVYYHSLFDSCLSHPLLQTSRIDYQSIPVLSHLDVSNFIKLLKKNLPYGFRFYILGEYGGKRLRPHYHALFFINSSKFVFSEFEQSCRGLWTSQVRQQCNVSSRSYFQPLGHVDCQYVDKSRGVSRYVSSYVSTVSDLPQFLVEYFPQFHTQSRTDFGFVDNVEESYEQIFYSGLTQVHVTSDYDGTSTLTVLPSHFEHRLFPRLDGRSSKHIDLPCLRHLACVSLCGFSDFASWMHTNVDSPIADVVLNYLSPYLLDDEKKKNHWQKLYSWSRRVISLSRGFHCSIDDVLYYIDKYYSNKALLRLREFYTLQRQLVGDEQVKQTPFKHYDAKYLISLYQLSDTYKGTAPSFGSLMTFGLTYAQLPLFYSPKNFTEYLNYAMKHKKIRLDSSKTKLRNYNFNEF